MGNAPDSQDQKSLYHWVFSVGVSAIFGMADAFYFWPENRLAALLVGAAILSLFATYELRTRGISRRLVVAIVVSLFALAIAISWRVGPVNNALRPLIDVTPRGLENLAPGDESRVGVTYRSAQTSPATAYDLRSNVQVFVAPFPLPASYPMPTEPKVFESSGNLVPGGERDGFGHTMKPLTLEQVVAVEDGSNMRLYVAGTLGKVCTGGSECSRG